MFFCVFFLGRLLFRERQTQIPQTVQPAATQALHSDTSEIKATDSKPEEQLSSVHEGSTLEDNQSKHTDPVTTDEPMETQPATDNKVITRPDDDEQPKSKLTSHSGSYAGSNQSSISTNQTAASSTVGGASSDEDLPYFPAHPISYFPEEAESSASAAVARQPPRRSMFDHEVPLYAISEDEPSLMPTLESFKVRICICTCRCDFTKCRFLSFLQFPPVVTAMLQPRIIPRSPPKVYDVCTCNKINQSLVQCRY